MSTSKIIMLKSSNSETFEVEEAVALESQTIKHLIEDTCVDTSVPLLNVTCKILAKVIEYCKKHVETPKLDDKIAKDELRRRETKIHWSEKLERSILNSTSYYNLQHTTRSKILKLFLARSLVLLLEQQDAGTLSELWLEQ
ncbi:hypothetical protein U1Q18_023124 [Sarracenia purpurea var. burkii]